MRLARNAKCPCGSGAKYKACCLKKGLEFEVGPDGTVAPRFTAATDDLGRIKRLVCATDTEVTAHLPDGSERIFLLRAGQPVDVLLPLGTTLVLKTYAIGRKAPTN